MNKCSRRDVIGHPLTDFLDETNLNRFKNQVARRKKVENHPCQVVLKRKDRKKTYVTLSEKPMFDDQGNYQGSITFLTDITEHYRVEEELKKSRERLRELSTHLQSIKEKESKRIAQEALTNVARHANATKVNVSLKSKYNGSLLELRIEDNGRGITKDEISKSKSFGLIGMQERINLIRGKFRVSGAKNKGTTLIASIPLDYYYQEKDIIFG